jgi:hypothetical protein
MVDPERTFSEGKKIESIGRSDLKQLRMHNFLQAIESGNSRAIPTEEKDRVRDRSVSGI